MYIDLMPTELNRATTQNRLNSNEARILERVNINWMFGRMRRGAGVARGNMDGRTNSIFGVGLVYRFDGSVGIIAHTEGTICVCFGDSTAPINGGVIPLWTDAEPTQQQINSVGGTGEHVDEEREEQPGVY